MKKQLILFLIFTAFRAFVAPVAAQEDCADVLESIRNKYAAKDWSGAKVECQSFLNRCGSSGEVMRIMDECEKKIKEATSPKPNHQPKIQKFSVNKDFIVINADGGSEIIKVTANNSWSIAYQPSWVRVARSGNSINISCASNDGTSARLDDIVLKEDNGSEIRISIKQNFTNDYLRTTIEIDDKKGTGGVFDVPIQSNKVWYIKNKPDWCTIEKVETGLVSVRLPINRSGAYRESNIEVTLRSNPNISSYIKVKQAVASGYIKLSPTAYTCTGKVNFAEFDIETDYGGTYRVEGLPNWCSVTETGRNSFVVRVESNAGGGYREAHGKVVAGYASESFTIKQNAWLKYIDLSASIINAPTSGCLTTLITVKSSGVWDVVNLPTWCVEDRRTNEGFSIRVMPNTSGIPRSAQFVVVSSDGEKKYVKVNQE